MPDSQLRPECDPCSCKRCRKWSPLSIYIDGIEIGLCRGDVCAYHTREHYTCNGWAPRLMDQR